MANNLNTDERKWVLKEYWKSQNAETVRTNWVETFDTQAPKPNSHDLYFQQDGAPPHYSRAVREYLDETFPEKWIGRRGPIDWLARSPDLTPMDFFFWGVLKDKVYSRKPRSVGDLKNYIRDAFQEINTQRDLCKNVCRSVRGRLQSCVNCDGKQFEHLR